MYEISAADIERFLDEALPPEQMAALEQALQEDKSLRQQLVVAVGRRDAGLHTLGGIWRQYRVSCPGREQLGSYLLDVLDAPATDYIRFHLEDIGCRYCQASVADLRQQHAADEQATDGRRTKYFQSSAGYLSPED